MQFGGWPSCADGNLIVNTKVPRFMMRISIFTAVVTLMLNWVSPAPAQAPAANEVLKLAPHPRLWVPPDTINNLKDKLHTPFMKSAAARILQDADYLVTATPIAQTEPQTQQQGTRAIASHLKCLTTAYVLTRDPKYRQAAMRHLENILTWKQISCEASVNTPAENPMFFCLSYGEHCADIALMYDIFRPDITEAEKKVFDDVLDRFYLSQALRAYERNPWWVNKEWSNWNGVCAGGMGMLALAFYDDRPEVRKLVPFVDESLGEYFKSYMANGGGNHEGTGYWNYGMHYAVRYLLSYERATGRKHPAFEIEQLGKSLNFPVDFTKITFGDNDGWHPTGFFFMMAARTNQPDAARRAATVLLYEVPPAPAPEKRNRLDRTHDGDILYAADFIPTSDEMAALKAERDKQKQPLARIYEGLGWAVLADDSAFPKLRLAARGGSSEVKGHGHLDLLSFKCMVNGVRFIEDQPGDNMAVNFTGRGTDLYARSPDAKSTLLVGGLGCGENTRTAAPDIVEGEGLKGIRIDGSKIYMPRWRGFIGRLFLMVDSAYWLVIDSAPGHGMESRFHTFSEVESGKDWALLTKNDEKLMMTFASLSSSAMQHSRGTPCYPTEQTKIIRWMNTGPTKDSLHVSALNPGTEKIAAKVSKEEGGYVIEVSGAGVTPRTIRLTKDLKLRE